MRASGKPLKSFDGFLAYCRAAFSGRATCGAAGVFVDSGCGEGEWFRTVVTHYARGLAAVPGLTTRDVKVEVRSSKKEVLREQYVCTGPGAGDYARVSWTATTRDALGQETLVVKSDGTRVRKT